MRSKTLSQIFIIFQIRPEAQAGKIFSKPVNTHFTTRGYPQVKAFHQQRFQSSRPRKKYSTFQSSGYTGVINNQLSTFTGKHQSACLYQYNTFSTMGICNSKDANNSHAHTNGTAATNNGKEYGIAAMPKPEKIVPVEAVVCKVDDMKDGEMREVDVGPGKALLIKDLGAYTAIGHKCTHYGAPLVKGVLCNGRVRCPWHGACFNIQSGDIEDFPGLDGVQKFEVDIKDDNVIVKTHKKALEKTRRIKEMSSRSPDEEVNVVLIGGGAASSVCAETLRQEGFKGRIVIATKEKHLPYDRPKLSKALDSSASDIALRDQNFYSVYDIEVMTESEAVSIDTVLNAVTFQNGDSINYDHLLIATGGRPRILPIPGHDLQNVCLLRTPDDANAIAKNAKGKQVVIIGTSFIGMEVASYLVDKANHISVIGRGNTAFQASLGEQLGVVLQRMLEAKNVKFFMNNSVKAFHGEGGKLNSVELASGETLPAELCVVGAGVVPTTEFLKESGLTMNARHQLSVDKFMRTSKANVYAAGDIVEFPLAMLNGERVNIQHWQIAHMHGRIAALNMLGQDTEVNTVPYFWTMMLGKSLRFTGYNVGYDDTVIDGNLDELQFVAYYTRGDNVVAVASMNSDPAVSQAAEMFLAGKEIRKSELQGDKTYWKSLL
ncbi:apoptosis-inducing factor 3-like isoform X2 [Ptychodera flava]|uniref:apoptosis-inducing factor 3-like isoform X2 n=1 Tax=Ptychodera flava TaxID=63121 RepID=UPI00396A565F